MKKTIIALSLASVFSANALADSINVNPHNNVSGLPGSGIEQPIDRPMPDNTPDRPQPVDPDFGVKPNSNVPDRNGPNYTPERPQPADPDFGVTPDSNVPDREGPNYTPERPQPADPDFGITPDDTPEKPQPADPDFGVTPDGNTPDRPEPVDPNFGITPRSDAEKIADLEKQMNYRFDEMAEHMDGIRAGLHAVTNARPYVTEGEFAIGAGIGFSGNKEAIALGGAYGLNEKISISGTFHYETSGRVSGSEVAGGMGIQFKF
ncbi:YadA-like family protein [Parasalinivibrio latis]|uniref:YadA C-terminal domain-containing protein n=1 Tax=Parasalinivibrio latis TaxID=2952610 RepID=UPI0030E26539